MSSCRPDPTYPESEARVFTRADQQVLLALVVVATALRIPGLGSGLWFDEIWLLIDHARRPFAELLTTWGSDNNHPLYTLLAAGSIRTFGESAWALRLPAAFFGVAGVAALYHLARRLVDRREAALVAFLLAISYHHVWFSQNARGYTALLFFTLVATDAWLAGVKSRGRAPWIVQGLALALASWVHLTGVFVAIAQLLVWAGSRWRSGREAVSYAPLLGVLLGGAVSLLVHLPMLREMIDFLFVREHPVRMSSEWSQPLWTFFETARSFGVGPGLALAAVTLFGIVFGTGLFSLRRRNLRTPLLFLLPGVLGAVLMLNLERNLWPRFFFFLAGFLLLIVVRGTLLISRAIAGRVIRKPGAGFAVATLVLVLGSLALLPRNYRTPKQDFEGARDWVKATAGPDDVVVTVGLATFAYQDWLGEISSKVETPDQLDLAMTRRKRALVLTTLPVYLRSRHAALAEALDARGHEIARFPGTVGGGDVVVLEVLAR